MRGRVLKGEIVMVPTEEIRPQAKEDLFNYMQDSGWPKNFMDPMFVVASRLKDEMKEVFKNRMGDAFLVNKKGKYAWQTDSFWKEIATSWLKERIEELVRAEPVEETREVLDDSVVLFSPPTTILIEDVEEVEEVFLQETKSHNESEHIQEGSLIRVEEEKIKNEDLYLDFVNKLEESPFFKETSCALQSEDYFKMTPNEVRRYLDRFSSHEEGLLGGRPRRGRRKNARGGRPRGRKRGVNSVPTSYVPGVLVAPETDVMMSYPLSFLVTNAIGTSQGRIFQPNGLYDLDPTIGSTAIPGFTEYTGFYNYYRVMSYRVICEFANSEAFPVSVYFFHLNTNPGSAATTYQLLAMNPLGKTYMLAAEGGVSKGKYTSKWIHVSKVVGTPAVSYEDNFRGTAAANPADLVYFGMGIGSVNGNFTAGNGVSFEMRLDLRVKWFDRKSITT